MVIIQLSPDKDRSWRTRYKYHFKLLNWSQRRHKYMWPLGNLLKVEYECAWKFANGEYSAEPADPTSVFSKKLDVCRRRKH
jgi:hypothetical protein